MRARLEQEAEEVRQLAQLSDAELISRTPANTSLSRPRPQMEMQRRLKDATERLAAETVKARESSEQLSAELHALVAGLTSEIVTFRKSSDEASASLTRLTRWLIGFTVALLVVGVATLVASTVLAVWK